jgi:hypothetical protein
MIAGFMDADLRNMLGLIWLQLHRFASNTTSVFWSPKNLAFLTVNGGQITP